MFAEVPLFPEQASTHAPKVDALLYFLLGVTGTMALLITILILYFAARYRRRSVNDRTPRILGNLRLELFWTITPMFFFVAMYLWGASVFFDAVRPPEDGMEIFVVGKQWMWKIQHQTGQREINQLHVPVGQQIKLTMTSEDVIHDFSVPSFRTKMDVLPGRYVHVTFKATKPGTYDLFCSQYCGTNHAGMIGSVVVMEPAQFDNWLASQAEGSLALQGRKLFLKLQCVTCHSADNRARAPVLEGLYGTQVHLDDGRTVPADWDYIKESILKPRAKIVAGWRPIMPSFDGQLADDKEGLGQEEALIELISYIKSLRPGETPVRTEDFAPPALPLAPEGDKNP